MFIVQTIEHTTTREREGLPVVHHQAVPQRHSRLLPVAAKFCSIKCSHRATVTELAAHWQLVTHHFGSYPRFDDCFRIIRPPTELTDDRITKPTLWARLCVQKNCSFDLHSNVSSQTAHENVIGATYVCGC